MKKAIFILFTLIIHQLFAQQKNVEFTKENFKGVDGFKDAKSAIRDGDNFYEEALPILKDAFKGNYDLFQQVGGLLSQAITHYLDANKFNPNNAQLNYKIGVCYVYSRFKSKALSYFEKAYALDPNVAPEIHYYLGRGYHLNMDWDKAISEYKAYQSKINISNEPERLADVVKKIEECENGRELVKKPVRVFIDNLGSEINSSYPDYGAVISADESEIIFTSRRDGSTGGKIDEGTGMYFEDIYISYLNNGKWTPAKNLGKPINTDGHDANLGLAPDGQKLFVYKDDNGDGNIYESKLKGDQWQRPEKMSDEINGYGTHESSCSISYDGKRLFFVSDKPDGNGYRDIYMSSLDKKKRWGKAVNLGPVINTKYGEEGVFAHPDGKTIYFSSQGHNTMGGYDIFKSVYDFKTKQWSEPENLGYPINTPDDDVFFVISGSGKHGYYSSIKNEGFGDKDIYKITFLGPEKPVVINNEDNLIASLTEPVKETVIASAVEIKTAQITILKGIVSDEGTKKPIEATIEIVDNQLNEVIASFTSNSTTGRYLVSLPSGKNYGIAVKADNYLFHSENFDIPATADYQEVYKDVALKNISVGSKIVLNNIFFDFGKATLRSESTAELERLTKMLNEEIPSLRIEISGHTDNKSSADFNQKLSEARAKAVVDYLVAHGVNQSRLEYKGYGFSQPVASNDTEEGRQQNRRTEFKVLSK